MEGPIKPRVPAKVFVILNELLAHDERLAQLMKTTWKPNAAIPTLWLAITDWRLLLFSTRQDRSLFKKVPFGEIDTIRVEHGKVIEVLMNDVHLGDLRIPIAPEYRHLVSDSVRGVNSHLKHGS